MVAVKSFCQMRDKELPLSFCLVRWFCGRSQTHRRPHRAPPGLVFFAACLTAGLLFAPRLACAAEPSAIQNVSISKPFVNPSLGEKIGISFTVAHPGSLTILILDRDGFLVRKLVSAKPVEKGPLSFDWDCREDTAEIVPDEAYSLKVDLSSEGRTETYFPGNSPGEGLQVKTNYYDRRGAIFSYKLPKPARVHVQAGIARIDPKTKKGDGPVLKTLVNREPRPAGAVVENWNGFDEGGTFYVPDLPQFVMAVAASSLPENSLLTTGNRKTGFLERAAKRSGTSLFTYSVNVHEHHRGLAALDDVAPRLKVAPLNAAWSSKDRVWSSGDKKLSVSVNLEGLSADAFARQPGKLYVFLDQKRLRKISSPVPGMKIEVPLQDLKAGVHIVALNWASDYGPVAVSSIRIRSEGHASSTASRKR